MVLVRLAAILRDLPLSANEKRRLTYALVDLFFGDELRARVGDR